MTCNINEVVLTPLSRAEHIDNLRRVEGLTNDKIREIITHYKSILGDSSTTSRATTHFLDDILTHIDRTGSVEANDCCYSGLALTGVKDPEERKKLQDDHYLIKEAVRLAGLKNYDPAEAPFNPQNALIGQPQEVSDVDILMVLASRFFTFTNLAPSSGGGMEERTANMYTKMPLVFVKKGKYTSRMTTGARRIILLEYSDLTIQKEQVVDVLCELRKYEPGVGTCSVHGNTLLGFEGEKTFCLPGLIQQKFPILRYDFSQYNQ